MSAPQPQVSWDDRLVLQRARRAQLIRVCRAEGIEVKREDMPHKWYLNMLEQNGVNLNAPHSALDWYQVNGKDEQGNQHTETYPVIPEHASKKENVNYDQVIQERAEATMQLDEANKKLEDSQKINDDQNGMIQQLMDRLEKLEATTVPIDRLGPPQLKRVCKDRGIDITGLHTKEELLAALEG